MTTIRWLLVVGWLLRASRGFSCDGPAARPPPFPRTPVLHSSMGDNAGATGERMTQARELLRACVGDRSASSDRLVDLLTELEARPIRPEAPDLQGSWELVFSSSVASLPLVGNLLGGYFPNREIVELDFAAGLLTLEISTLPGLGSMTVTGKNLRWRPCDDEPEESPVLSYRVANSDMDTTWKILAFFGDDGVLAVKSSKTGYNVLRRV